VRTLTVENFSVIKYAKLEFGKITVLIGPQASGKSLLCKIAYFLGHELIHLASERANQQFELSNLCQHVKVEFERRFPSGGWGSAPFRIHFRQAEYEVELLSPSKTNDGSETIGISFSTPFQNAYEDHNWASGIAQFGPGPGLDYYRVLFALRKLQRHRPLDRLIYIPSGRSYFINSSKGYRVLAAEGDVEPLLKGFAILFEDARSHYPQNSSFEEFLGGKLLQADAGYLFQYHDGRILPLDKLASGSQELLPMLCVLEAHMNGRSYESQNETVDLKQFPADIVSYDEIYIEEPEAHIFPSMQTDLVRFLVESYNSKTVHPEFAITTHSPYILSAFGNLIMAGRVAREHSERATALEKVIPRQYWVDPEGFGAYALKPSESDPGKFETESIFNRKTGELDGDYLDNVSSDIAEEFSELLELQYGG
jgi:hypothetical protein